MFTNVKASRSHILVVVILVVVVAFTGCSKTTTETTADNEAGTTITDYTNNDTITDITTSPYIIEDEEISDEEYLSLYLEEVQSLVDDEGYFDIDEVTSELIKKLGVNRDEVYYPVTINGVLVYTDQYGRLELQKFEGGWGNNRTLAYNVHVPAIDTAEAEAVRKDSGYAVMYTQETGLLEFWSFGQKTGKYQLPKEAVYCGYSAFYGYEFRTTTGDVLVCGGANPFLRNGIETNEPTCIAHGVKFVVLPDYRFGSDPWCQPLFLMEDGSIKCHISWRGKEGSPMDDPSHLVDVVTDGIEGGYGH